MTRTASFGGEDGGVEESQGCGVPGISIAVGMGCAAVISAVGGSIIRGEMALGLVGTVSPLYALRICPWTASARSIMN